MADDPYVIRMEGVRAFNSGTPATDCPYTFDKSTFWMAKDYAGFATVRWKLDAWMAGWIEEQNKQRGADSRLKPKGRAC